MEILSIYCFAGEQGTPSSQSSGSISGKAKVVNIDKDERIAILKFELSDTLSMSSLTRDPITRYSLIQDNPKTKDGEIILGNVKITFTWQAKVSY